MEVLILHVVHQVHQPEIILHHLVGIPQVGAEKFIVAEVLLLYLLDYLEKLLAQAILGLRHLAHPFQVVLGEAKLIVVSILLICEDAVVLLVLILERSFTPLAGHVEGLLVPRQPIVGLFESGMVVVR